MTLPIAIPRTADNAYSQLEDRKELLARDLEAVAAKLGLPGEVTKSALHQPDPWVQWTGTISRPAGDNRTLQRRLGLRVFPRAVPFHRHPVLYRLELFDNDFHGVADDLIRCDAADLERALDRLGRGAVPVRRIARRLGLAHLRPGWLGLPFLFGVVNKIDLLRPPIDLWAAALGLVLGLAGGASAAAQEQPPWAAAGFLVATACLVALVLLWRRNHWVVTSGKPMSEPRTLQRWDEWQVLLPAIGGQAAALRRELLETLKGAAPAEARAWLEDEWHWGLDGKEVRPQLVVTYRRAVAFVHVTAYGDDLYVGWNAHVNRGQWAEVEVARGVLRGEGRLVALHSVVHGLQQVSEFDLHDATSVGEFCHRHAVKLVRRIVKEHAIDVEVDFRVVRERRATEQKQEATRGGLFDLFRRTG